MELWLPLHERASVPLLQSDPSYAETLEKEFLASVSCAPARLSVRFEASDDDSQPCPGYVIVGIDSLFEGFGLSSGKVADILRSCLMLSGSDLSYGSCGKLLDLSAIRDTCEVSEGTTAKQVQVRYVHMPARGTDLVCAYECRRRCPVLTWCLR